MKLFPLSSAAILLLGLATSLPGFAQAPAAGTAVGTNTDSVSAGTGNAGDKTQQPDAAAAAGKSHPKHRHHHHRAHHAASAASCV
jgi:hypothetical protein